jgi:hypothetical protein
VIMAHAALEFAFLRTSMRPVATRASPTRRHGRRSASSTESRC